MSDSPDREVPVVHLVCGIGGHQARIGKVGLVDGRVEGAFAPLEHSSGETWLLERCRTHGMLAAREAAIHEVIARKHPRRPAVVVMTTKMPIFQVPRP